MTKEFAKSDNCLAVSFEDRLKEMPELSKKERISYCRQNEEAIRNSILPAYQELDAYVDSLLATSATTPPASTSSSYSVNRKYLPEADTPAF